jgi:hypothetical protein
MRINFGGFRKMKKQLEIIGVIFLLATITISGCSEQKKPVITSFEATPDQIEIGQSTQLSWIVSEATSVTIDNGIGTVTLSGNRTITPMETTTYTLTAKSSTTVTATVQIIVIDSGEKPNISMVQSEYFVQITGTTNKHINQTQAVVTVINKVSGENQTSAIGPSITDGNSNPKTLGVGDLINFSHLADFPAKEEWTIQVSYKGEIIGQCSFRNPPAPYNTPFVLMSQSGANVTIIGIINGPLNQTLCSIVANNKTNGVDQSSVIGASISDGDKNPALIGIGDKITFSNLGKFRKGDQWTIQLEYNGKDIGQCTYTNQGVIIKIPN